MYLKRARTPTTWPIKRKGTKYVVVPSHNWFKGVPLLIIARELLGLGSTRREVRKAMLAGGILVNGKPIKKTKYGLSLNDTITLKSGENYRLTYSENKKFTLEKINPSESLEKISKITGQRIVKGGKFQVSLLDGRNLLTNNGLKIGNSVIVDLKTNDMKKEIPLQKGSEIIVISGKHIGKRGRVENLEEGVARVAFKDKKIGLQLKSLMALK